MNWQQVRTNWNDVSQRFHTRWGRLTDADLKAIGGRRNELIKRLQRLYAWDKVRAEKEAEDFVEGLH